MPDPLTCPEVLAVIPARGGSKGVPRKNIKLLDGRPLIAFSVDAARESRRVTRVVVSTEDAEIADVAGSLGAEVPFLRPPDLAGDRVLDLPVFQHCLRWLLREEAYSPDLVVHLRPTAPLRTYRHIDDCIDLLLRSPDADSVRSVCAIGQHPLKSWRITQGRLHPFVPEEVHGIEEPYNRPRQELPEAFVQNGSVDVVRPHVILSRGSMSGSRILAYVMPEEVSVNIDTPLDWALAVQTLRAGLENASTRSSMSDLSQSASYREKK